MSTINKVGNTVAELQDRLLQMHRDTLESRADVILRMEQIYSYVDEKFNKLIADIDAAIRGDDVTLNKGAK